MYWQPLLTEYLPTLAVLCRQLRRQPGQAFVEKNTAALVAATLVTLGLKTASGIAANGGVTGLLPGPGPAVAIRVGIDPQPNREGGDLPYGSAEPRAGRAEGIAVALGAAMVLANLPAPPGAVKFIFQPAGEGSGDARRMVEEGVLDNPPVEAVFGFCLTDTLGVGQVGITYGQTSAATDDIRITVIGRDPQPNQTVDAIVVAAQVVGGLQTIVSRQLSPLDAVSVTIGTIKGGRASGLVADRVEMAGTASSLTESARTGLPEKIERVVAGITAAHGASYRFVYSQGCPPLVNDTRLTARLEESAARVVGRENILRLPPNLSGEDFAHFAQAVPGAWFEIGSGSPRCWQPGRHSRNDACEEAIAAGVSVLVQTILDYFA